VAKEEDSGERARKSVASGGGTKRGKERNSLALGGGRTRRTFDFQQESAGGRGRLVEMSSEVSPLEN